MGQSSSNQRHDNASTRTLHSTSIETRPSLFKRISKRIPNRRQNKTVRPEEMTMSDTVHLLQIPNDTGLNIFVIEYEHSPWMFYVLNDQHFVESLPEQVLNDLLVNNNNLATLEAVNEVIPAVDWSDELKDDQCLVCLDDFCFKQSVRILKCRHVFHTECVDKWLCEAHNSCPVCRRVPI